MNRPLKLVATALVLGLATGRALADDDTDGMKLAQAFGALETATYDCGAQVTDEGWKYMALAAKLRPREYKQGADYIFDAINKDAELGCTMAKLMLKDTPADILAGWETDAKSGAGE